MAFSFKLVYFLTHIVVLSWYITATGIILYVWKDAIASDCEFTTKYHDTQLYNFLSLFVFIPCCLGILLACLLYFLPDSFQCTRIISASILFLLPSWNVSMTLCVVVALLGSTIKSYEEIKAYKCSVDATNTILLIRYLARSMMVVSVIHIFVNACLVAYDQNKKKEQLYQAIKQQEMV
jgi:hypothetical protein